jgi:hypothetical protein
VAAWPVVAAALALELKLGGASEASAMEDALLVTGALQRENASLVSAGVSSIDPDLATPAGSGLSPREVCDTEASMVETCSFRLRVDAPHRHLDSLAEMCKFDPVIRAVAEQCLGALVVAPEELLESPSRVATTALYVACVTKALDPSELLGQSRETLASVKDLVAELVAQSRQVVDPARARKQIVSMREFV